MRRGVAAGVVAAAVAGLVFFSVDRCPPVSPAPPRVVERFAAHGTLEVGTATVAIDVPVPVVRGGFPPPRPTVERLDRPPEVRATAVQVGERRVTLAVVDALLVTEELQAAADALDLGPVVVVATHTHASVGSYSPSLAVQVAGLGQYRPEVAGAMARALAQAVTAAGRALAPATLWYGEATADGLTVPRSGEAVDRRLTVVDLVVDGGPGARLVVFAAHPTLVPREVARLHPGWPGELSRRQEQDGGPVTLVLPGNVGNAAVDRTAAASPEAFAVRLDGSIRAVPRTGPLAEVALEWSAVEVTLPAVDSSRLAPWPVRGVVDNALCDGLAPTGRLALLGLGPVRLLFMPVEGSAVAGAALEARASATRAVSLGLGYLGYVEPAEDVLARRGEALRQYFTPELLEVLAGGAERARGDGGPGEGIH